MSSKEIDWDNVDEIEWGVEDELDWDDIDEEEDILIELRNDPQPSFFGFFYPIKNLQEPSNPFLFS